MPSNKPRSAQAPWLATPDIEEIGGMVMGDDCEATDGCWVEPDGWCEHGNNSWLLEMGMI